MKTKKNSNISRRQFLQILAFGGAAGCVVGASAKFPFSAQVWSESRLLAGTVINLTIVDADPDHARMAMDAVFGHMASLESIFSRFVLDSELSLLNRDGFSLQPHPQLVQLLQQAQVISERTNGCFDISIKPLVDLYESEANNGKSIPEIGVIQRELDKVDFKKIIVDDRQVHLLTQGMGVTFDGIAKGYIVDQGVAELKKQGYVNVVVEAGGDLYASGEKSACQAWRVGVQSPRQANSTTIERIRLSNRAMATSGDYQQYFSSDLANHHILNPKTGRSSPFLASASVLAPSCMEADAYATALMVMDPDEGLSLVEQLVGVEALLVTKQMDKIFSTGFLL